VLVLSPHLDDAVLSCSGYIQSVAASCRVIVATVFAQSDPGHAALYRRRRAEDREAIRLLGARPMHMPFLDAPFRSPEYRDFFGIVFGCAPEYRTTLQRVARQIRETVARYQPAGVLAPLAAGNHVDHRLVRAAALAAVDPTDLFFYEDRPYAFVREQLLHVLGRPMDGRPERFWRRYFRTSYIRNYLGSGDREEVKRCWANMPAFPGMLRRAVRITLPPEHLQNALRAIRAYRSQIGDLFTSDAELEECYANWPEVYWVSRDENRAAPIARAPQVGISVPA
jgi:LmbE family N-acetylglucosaminyl deacetylase